MEGREIRVLLALALVSVALCGAEDGYCTEDSCSEGTELQDIGETSFQWWNLNEMVKYIINTIKFILYRKIEQAQNATIDIVESLKGTITHRFEVISNQTVKIAEAVYNKTAEFAEKVRDVLREEFDNFVELLWEEGSLEPIPVNGMGYIVKTKTIRDCFVRRGAGHAICVTHGGITNSITQ